MSEERIAEILKSSRKEFFEILENCKYDFPRLSRLWEDEVYLDELVFIAGVFARHGYDVRRKEITKELDRVFKGSGFERQTEEQAPDRHVDSTTTSPKPVEE